MNKDNNSLHVAVRALVEFIYQSGDLTSAIFSNLSGAEGTRLHQKVISLLEKEYPDNIVQSELQHHTIVEFEEFSLSVSGRSDAILFPRTPEDEDAYTIVEIKTHNRLYDKYEELYHEVHMAQAKAYAHLFLLENEALNQIRVQLRYYSANTLKSCHETIVLSRVELESFFNTTCKLYLETVKRRFDYIHARNRSIRGLEFPHLDMRDGQKQFMSETLSAAKQKNILLVQAPTGIGKTIGVLYPAVKSLPHQWFDKVLYLTAKISTRASASKALNQMRESGLFIRSIVLSAKESMCPCPDIYCEPSKCKYALGYYDRQKEALAELLLTDALDAGIVKVVADKHVVCPHELSLDASESTDIIIGDYSHAFHPRIRLDRYMTEAEFPHFILVDEAHNLVDRSREMYSASLSRNHFIAFKFIVSGLNPRVEGHVSDIIEYFSCLEAHLIDNDPAFPYIEPAVDNKNVMITDNFRATTTPPKILYASLWRMCFHLAPLLDRLPETYDAKAIRNLFFEARFFLTILEYHYDSSYIYTAKRLISAKKDDGPDDFILTLACLDASSKIAKTILDRHSAVFFSATLSPMQYYRFMFVGNDHDYTNELILHSPFPAENFAVGVYTKLSTAFKEREWTKSAIADIIEALSHKNGHYLVFFPSFRYMDMVHRIVESRTRPSEARIIVQTPEMSADCKASFMGEFERFDDRPLIAFAIMGGHFGEGIDLIGDRLNGVIIVGAGLPQISPERQILLQYFQEKFSDGFAFAYRFPGWEKVLQASGRVIRDESDVGFALLIDHRYDKNEYRSLFPEHWQYQTLDSTQDVLDFIEKQ